MKDRATGRARGFGFVVFADPSIADQVVQEKHTIDGRQVRCAGQTEIVMSRVAFPTVTSCSQ
jgi:RNA recognition motif-containing protein